MKITNPASQISNSCNSTRSINRCYERPRKAGKLTDGAGGAALPNKKTGKEGGAEVFRTPGRFSSGRDSRLEKYPKPAPERQHTTSQKRTGHQHPRPSTTPHPMAPKGIIGTITFPSAMAKQCGENSRTTGYYVVQAHIFPLIYYNRNLGGGAHTHTKFRVTTITIIPKLFVCEVRKQNKKETCRRHPPQGCRDVRSQKTGARNKNSER